MSRHATCGAALMALALISLGCGAAGPHPPLKLGPQDLGSVLKCSPWSDDEKKRAGVVGAREPAPGTEDIGVVIHVMLAGIEQDRRDKEYRIDHAWALAPVHNAARIRLANVIPTEPDTEVEFWTPEMIHTFFSRDGKVNEIWRQYHIRLILRAGEDCTYFPHALRPDGLVRDSIPTPQTTTPWANQFYRSVNRLFTDGPSNLLHVFLWWSVAEADIDDVDVLGGTTRGGNSFWGYSRSAARGGPAVWIGTYDCLQPLESTYQGQCAKVIAHEVGHALGLHHVEEPFRQNLMFKDAGRVYKEKDPGLALSESQQKQALQEAREQFAWR